ncbi:hypothetical protein M9H77_31244 [Catharanthus roseus]|uniref:Uncharacterized protein n=1 Tax=Catharanthus roseus TaxID=4058 RepID=A0ACB9ZZL3_CATRO|nr:hypothetical protein M9H77_31244 [Catharanthus roseus]
MRENYEEGGSSRDGRTRKRKGKRVASEVRLLERLISVKAAANFEERTRKRRKITPGHWVDLSDMEEPLLTVNELYYPEMIYEFYANLYKGRVQKQGNITYQWVTSRVGSRDISFDDRILNTILGTFGNIFQYFVINLVGVGDHIGIGKIYNKHTFKRMAFSRNEEGMLVRGGQESEEEEEEDEGQDAMNEVEEVSEEEQVEEREMRKKKRQERVEEAQSLEGISQLMEMIASM